MLIITYHYGYIKNANGRTVHVTGLVNKGKKTQKHTILCVPREPFVP